MHTCRTCMGEPSLLVVMLPIVLGALMHAQEHGGLWWYGLGMLAVCMSPTMAVHYRACGLDLPTMLVFDNAPPAALKPLI